jgi:hypothetical protein
MFVTYWNSSAQLNNVLANTVVLFLIKLQWALDFLVFILWITPIRGFFVIASMFFFKRPYVFAYYRVIQKSPYIGINLMDQQFPGYCIGPDLTPLDFYLWGLLKATVYQVKTQYMDHLKERIRDTSERITSDVLTRVRH